MQNQVEKILEQIIKLPHDINGNPRYYVSAEMFRDEKNKLYRPFNAVKYRGKKFQEGWVFQSYNIKRSIENAVREGGC